MNHKQKNQKTSAFALIALTAVTLLAMPAKLRAQTLIPDNEGKPLPNTGTAADIDGSIYFKIDWADGTISRKNGNQYTGLKLRYDDYDDQIVFKDTNNDPEVPVYPDITSFTLKNIDGIAVMNFANGFPPVDKFTAKSFYEVLCAGKIKLLKHNSKTIVQRSDGGDAVTKSFKDEQIYYICKDGVMTAVKPDAKDITAALGDKGAPVAAYAKSNHLSFKDDADLGKIFDYLTPYN